MTRFILALVVALLALPSLAQTSIVEVMGQNPYLKVGSVIEVFSDKANSYSFEQVAKLDSFKRANTDVLNLGLSDGSHWLRLKIRNRTMRPSLMLALQQPVLDHAELYVVYEDGHVRSQEVTSSLPFMTREYQHQDYLFDIWLPTGQEATIYVKVQALEALLLPVVIGTETSVLQRLTLNDFLNGLYYGLMLVMILYNLFVWYSLRDPLYLRYVFYVFCVAITQACLQGYGFRLLWPDLPSVQLYAVPIAGAFSGISTLLFIRPFLHMAERAPLLNKIMLGILGYYFLILGVIVTGKLTLAYSLIDLGALLGAVVIMAAAIQVTAQGYRPAKFILVSWTVFLLAVIVFVLKDYDIIPYTNLTSHALLIGSGLEVVLLSIALADRINTLKAEKEHSQAEAIQVLQENERLVREQNVILEQRVAERTLSLQASNKELSIALSDLKETQTQLVDAEKMATLGQLTAGIAHEINNPINFVISNVAPLRRDFNDIKEVLEAYAPATGENWTEDNAAKVRALIQDIELDYVLDEVNKLLDGIDEGARRTAEIVKGLRNFSRLDESAMKKASMEESLEGTLVLLNSMIKNRIHVTRDYNYPEPIDCLPGKLNQVFMNIITNAIQVFDNLPDHPNPTIGLGLYDEGSNVRITISDNGTGMPEDVKKRIFEPFFSTKEVGKGTGLGLSIVYNIIKSHNGNITVESVPGHGTTFAIVIPKEQSIPATKAIAQ